MQSLLCQIWWTCSGLAVRFLFSINANPCAQFSPRRQPPHLIHRFAIWAASVVRFSPVSAQLCFSGLHATQTISNSAASSVVDVDCPPLARVIFRRLAIFLQSASYRLRSGPSSRSTILSCLFSRSSNPDLFLLGKLLPTIALRWPAHDEATHSKLHMFYCQPSPPNAVNSCCLSLQPAVCLAKALLQTGANTRSKASLHLYRQPPHGTNTTRLLTRLVGTLIRDQEPIQHLRQASVSTHLPCPTQRKHAQTKLLPSSSISRPSFTSFPPSPSPLGSKPPNDSSPRALTQHWLLSVSASAELLESK